VVLRAVLRVVAVLLAVLLMAAFLCEPARAATPFPSSQDRWIQAETAHFTLFSNATEVQTRLIGANLERLRSALSEWFTQLELSSPVTTRIFVFRDAASFKPYKKRTRFASSPSVVGFFIQHRDGNYLAIDASAGVTPNAVIYHEYLHYVLATNIPEVPTWFNEGMAELYSTFSSTGGEADIGRPIRNHLEWLLREPLIPLRELFAIDRSSRDYNEGTRQGVFYAQSWALVHYLMMGDAARKEQCTTYLTLLQRGTPRDEAFRSAFKISYETLDAQLTAYVRGRAFPYVRLKLRQQDKIDDARVSPMKREDVLYHLGDFIAHGHPDRVDSEAERLFQEALRIQPEHALAYAGLGYLRELEGSIDQAAALYARAVDQKPTDYLPYVLLGENLLTQLMQAGSHTGASSDGMAQARQARGLFQRALELNPDLPRISAALGATYVYEQGDVTAGIRHLEKAMIRLPGRADVAFNLVTLYLKAGERAQAQAVIDEKLRASEQPEMLEAARRAMLAADIDAANRLIQASRYGEGIAGLRRVMSSTTDASLKTQLARQISHVEEVQQKNAELERYNRAVTLANQQRLREALLLLEGLLGESRDAEVRRLAADLRGQIRQALEGR